MENSCTIKDISISSTKSKYGRPKGRPSGKRKEAPKDFEYFINTFSRLPGAKWTFLKVRAALGMGV